MKSTIDKFLSAVNDDKKMAKHFFDVHCQAISKGGKRHFNDENGNWITVSTFDELTKYAPPYLSETYKNSIKDKYGL